jgi:dimethylargininase
MKIAMTREVSPAIARCELTHLPRLPIDGALAREQHHRYEACLSELGYAVLRLPAEPDLPDSVFVEDAAVVLDELAVLTRPGAPSRRAETASIAAALEPYRTLAPIEPPAVLDGGDVLRVGGTLYVGLSGRTDEAGAAQLARMLEPLGYVVRRVAVSGCLHLKSAVTAIAPETVLVNPAWVSPADLAGLTIVEIDPSEPHAANALRAGDAVIYPAAFPRTRRRLEERGLRIVEVDLSELAKAEGAVTCCSLLID